MSNSSAHALTIVYQEQPLNAGTPLPILRRSFVTPQTLFFARNHGSIPAIDPATYRLRVGGMVRSPLEFSLEELQSRFPSQTIMGTLQCTGSRRDELMALHAIPNEIPWGAEPISNARWRGVALRDVLQAAGIAPEARYVSFSGLDEVWEEGKAVGFGSSIVLEKAQAPEVLLAFEMNGEPLTPMHGFPVRVIIPGYIGARSVKWLGTITLQDEPSHNYFQAQAYKLFPPNVTQAPTDTTQGKMLETLPLNAVICIPQDGQTLEAGPVRILGYAFTGEGSPIQRVEVSADKGTTWTIATITERNDPWAWCFWETTLNLPPGPCQLFARAWDAAGHTQPADARQLWNFKGYANNAWHRIRLHLT
ncbi:sulfite oxidase [Ktedonobacter racemifer]|uniref:Sulfite oxidase n=1 Tax=Ktedonobacter racemifer DSM 44963 TaxID=485913 RepID=D6TU29_KTERA|nr:sulfite oxidase [Ktedonobacter racemifer]EFH83930.1 Sulfite oxidase [Ktedonobacter racemifer DSM 44963]